MLLKRCTASYITSVRCIFNTHGGVSGNCQLLTNTSAWSLKLLTELLHSSAQCFMISFTSGYNTPSSSLMAAWLFIGWQLKALIFFEGFKFCEGDLGLLLLFFIPFKSTFSALGNLILVSICSIFCSKVNTNCWMYKLKKLNHAE